jgi:hypothetical protein
MEAFDTAGVDGVTLHANGTNAGVPLSDEAWWTLGVVVGAAHGALLGWQICSGVSQERSWCTRGLMWTTWIDYGRVTNVTVQHGG